MIRYNPTSGEVFLSSINYRPRHCFLVSKLGEPLPDDIKRMRRTFEKYAKNNDITVIDANSITTGKDFLIKICDLIASVPLGVAIISDQLSIPTMCNIYYEIGLLEALGKETLVIKSKNCPIPSDFVRTEYIEYGYNAGAKIKGFLSTFFKQADYYAKMADGFEQKPSLAIDYLRRSYLITGKEVYREEAKKFFSENTFDSQRTAGILNFLKK